MSQAPKLNPHERKVLGFLARRSSDDGCVFTFAPICRATKLNRTNVRRACRSLARRGLTRFVRGLWSDDGEPAGAGYCATKDGEALMDAA